VHSALPDYLLAFRHGNENSKYIQILWVLVWCYTHSMPAACFGNNCGHLQGGAFQSVCYKIFL